MLKTVANLKDSVAALLSGLDLSNVDNLDGAIERSARTLVEHVDVPEASGTQNIILYSGVTNYLVDQLIFGTSLRDIRPQGISRPACDFVYKRQPDDFDREKDYLQNGTIATFEYVNGIPIIRIASVYPQQKIILDPMTATTGWSAVGSASGLALDRSFFYQYPASLRFNFALAGSQGGLTKTLTSNIDLTSYIGVGVAFLAVEMPSASAITSIGLRIGSDSSNYYEMTNTEGFLGAFVAGEFQLVDFDLSTATQVGTPVATAMKYIRAVANYDGTAQVNVRFGSLFISLPSPAQIKYQTAAIFKAANAVASTVITTDADSLLLADPAYTLMEIQTSMEILDQTGADSSSPTYQKWNRRLNGDPTTGDKGLYSKFAGDNPSQELRTTGTYYDMGQNYGRRGGN